METLLVNLAYISINMYIFTHVEGRVVLMEGHIGIHCSIEEELATNNWNSLEILRWGGLVFLIPSGWWP